MRTSLGFLFFALNVLATIWCARMEDYEYPATEQEETEVADPPEDVYINDTLQNKPPPSYEDDAIYPPKKKMHGRASFVGETYRWKTLNVLIDRTVYSKDDIKIINKAAHILYEILKPCGVHIGIWKEGKQPFGDYIAIVNGAGCTCSVGRRGGAQNLTLKKTDTSSCVHLGVVIHEFLHALGFGHEHSRVDRDEHIEILWDNIEPENHWIFEKDVGRVTLGLPYNENSIMHYNDGGFAKKGLKTMRSKHGKTLGHKYSNPQYPLEQMDIDMIKKAYCKN